MALFVRLKCGYWSHRKTVRLRAILGDAALWIPPRLWSYAAENQPDGDFSAYLPEELGILLGYSGDARAMLEALQQAGFMDGMQVHDWCEHNGYHQTFSERARKAAAARWKKKTEEKKETGQDKTRQETSIAPGMPGAFDQFWAAYPRKIGKADARKSWRKVSCNEHLPAILSKLEILKRSHDWTKENGQFIPHPTTWLNREGWHDEPPRAAPLRAVQPTFATGERL
jgi:hypothetical protein